MLCMRLRRVYCKSHPASARSTPNMENRSNHHINRSQTPILCGTGQCDNSLIHSFVRTLARFTVAFERKITSVLRRKRKRGAKQNDTNNNDIALIMKVYYCRLLYCNTRRMMILIILFIKLRERRDEWESIQHRLPRNVCRTSQDILRTSLRRPQDIPWRFVPYGKYPTREESAARARKLKRLAG